jgi:lipopolysaccharide export system permease protein
MRRLTNYLARMFATDAVILFGIVCFLLWMVNCLRSFDVVSVKGQGLLTLAFQGLLTMPPLALVFFYVCVGIGMSRALQALQTNHELHIIHTSYGLGSLWRATMVVAGIGVVCVLLLSNFIEPHANRRLNVLAASVAADLVSSTLKPQRFTQVTPGVVLLIGARAADGEISEFFADDRRDPATRRTYIAKSARVAADGEDYVLELRDGSLQYTEADGRFSEISFARYDLGVERLSQPLVDEDGLSERDSLSLVREALTTGIWSPAVVERLSERMGEGLRVIGICMLVLALAGFPSGKRARLALPMEVTVLMLAFAERGIGSYSPLGETTGALLMIIVAGTVLFLRIRPRAIRLEASA